MLKKIVASSSLVFMMFANEAKAFEFPEKLPFGEISANVTFASSYIWRGEVQNGNNPAIQGGFDWSMDVIDTYASLYVGTWGSPAGNTDGYLELDYYGGISGAVPGVEDYLSYDAGLLFYDYPGLGKNQSPSQDFLEYYGSLGVALPMDLGVSYYFGYSPSGYGGQYDYTYQNVSAELPIPTTPLTLFGAMGFEGSDNEGGENYTDYNFGISTSAFGLDWSVYYTATDGYTATGVDEDTSAGGQHVVFTMGASF